jgi:hypothetical protein
VKFDRSGTYLIVAHMDKTIKILKEDELSTPSVHPIAWAPSKEGRR